MQKNYTTKFSTGIQVLRSVFFSLNKTCKIHTQQQNYVNYHHHKYMLALSPHFLHVSFIQKSLQVCVFF